MKLGDFAMASPITTHIIPPHPVLLPMGEGTPEQCEERDNDMSPLSHGERGTG